MCGISGAFSYGLDGPPVGREEQLRVRDAMVARGPDGAGLWISPDERVVLAHRRLSIIDLSDAGAQPMATADGRLRVTFNGEIYNYRQLRRELSDKGFNFRSNSDTEVLLHLYADRGEGMVHALRGMYAFAIWDERDQRLFMARDPFGVKPLYYADNGHVVRFASQVKALVKGSAIDTAPEPAGSVGFLIWGSVPEPYTLYRGVRSLRAGEYGYFSRHKSPAFTQFFSISEEFRIAQDANPKAGHRGDEIRSALEESVRRHLIADVPVGVFLSAGLDSTTLAGLASEQSGTRLKAVTLGFPEFRGTQHDEVAVAASTAQLFGIDHEAHWITRDDFESELEKILVSMDQPTIDGVNTYFVSRAAARAGLKVALSGVGGDELFGGYPAFQQIPRVTKWVGFTRRSPFAGRLARRVLAPLLSRTTSPKYASAFEYGYSYGGAYLLRRALFMPWELDSLLDPSTIRSGLETLRLDDQLEQATLNLRHPQSRIAALEMSWYMRNQLLRDADWAGMAHSLEIRVPLVDVDLFRSLAPYIASEDPPKKRELLHTLRAGVPEQVASRPKSGFVTPVQEWVRRSTGASSSTRGLREWAKRVLPAQPRAFRAVALVTDAYGGRGGIAKFNRDFLGSVAGIPECAGLVAVPRHVEEAAELPRLVTQVHDASNSKWRFTWTALVAALQGPIDLVIIGHINMAPLGVLLASIRRVPAMLVIHGIDAWTPHKSALVRLSLGRLTSVVSVSQLTLDRFTSWAGARQAQQYVLPNCVDLTRFRPGPRSAPLASRLGLDGKTVIATVGRLDSRERLKGIDEMIEALPALALAIPKLSYLICGDGDDRARLEAKAASLNVRERVVFAGYVSEEEKADYYRLADAYVMPSRGEGFGIVFLEALACGIPVMGSCTDGSAEALMHGALGSLVNPSNPTDVVRGVIETLGRGRETVPDVPAFYSERAFAMKAEAIVRRTTSLPARTAAIADEGLVAHV